MAASGVLSIAFVVALRRVPPLPVSRRASTNGIARDIAEGAAYVWRDPFIRALCLLHVASATLARPFMEFIPALATNHLAGGAATVAMLTSSVGFGSVLGGLWLAQRDNRTGVVNVVLAAFLALSLITIAFVWTRMEMVAAGFAMAAGFGMIVRAAGLQTLLQSVADNAFRGRVMSIYALILNGGSILGAVGIGLMAERIGLSWAFTVSVGGALIVWLALRGPLLAAAKIRPPLSR
jgi:predicted MFS family arabinose efflux permease